MNAVIGEEASLGVSADADAAMAHGGARAIDLSIIIVSWNVWPLLRDCLYSIETLTAPPPTSDSEALPWRTYGADAQYTVEVIVVDNASTDETVTALPITFPWVRLVCSETNLGFTRGNNWGYRLSRGNAIFFLNPDTSLTAAGQSAAQAIAVDGPSASTDNRAAPPNILVLLHEALAADPMVGMVGPQLRYGDGSWQNSRRRFPTHWTGFFESTWLGQFWPGNPWARRMHMLDHPATAQHAVDWLNGSAMFCRREALAALCAEGDAGPFDEGFFMYSEELDLCQRMVRAGWRIRYVPQAVVVHYEGRSSEQAVARRHIIFNTSKVRYYRKYFGPRWAALLRSYLRLEYLIQIGLEALKWLLRHKPALRRQRIAAYWAIVRDGFKT